MTRIYNIAFVALVTLTMAIVGCEKTGTLSISIPSEGILIEVGHAGDRGSTTFKSHNICAIDVLSTPKGWSVVEIDMYTKTITVESPNSFENEEERSGTISLKGYTPEGVQKTISLYVAILENPDVDYRTAPANCYIANVPATRYLFDATVGGSATPLNTASITLIWQTTTDLVKYIDFHDGVGEFYIEAKESTDDSGTTTTKLTAGNALIGAYDAEGELLWTWHIWVTNSKPEEEVITLGGKTLMNINLGADCNSNGEKEGTKIGSSYGLYYQWGRRTPIVGAAAWDFALNSDMIPYNATGGYVRVQYADSSAEEGTVEWACANPSTMIRGNEKNAFDWLYEGHEALWSATAKSEHDPCPAGWRIPDSSVYANLTINPVDDDMAWKEAQGMYGWNLVDKNDQSKSYFFTAAGRRNYLDGRLDIMNDDDERPVPWSGYYWTASMTDDGKAEAMFFDLNSQTRTWNGFSSAMPMYRANAMPVRCVRE
ncbi:MAG: hypothetical protein IKY56_05230 [Alistipes sp.]|nr:hypothetical protein [Alistipes sp.]